MLEEKEPTKRAYHHRLIKNKRTSKRAYLDKKAQVCTLLEDRPDLTPIQLSRMVKVTYSTAYRWTH